jgi:hypothetical protein
LSIQASETAVEVLMVKRIVISIVAVFITWSVLDFVIHGVILKSSYEATKEFWRPMEEMKMGLMYFVTFVYAIVFVCIFAGFFKDRTVAAGLKYGLLFGTGAGIGMGFGTYSYMPIPAGMALTWFVGTVVEMAVAGVLTGWIISYPNNSPAENIA